MTIRRIGLRFNAGTTPAFNINNYWPAPASGNTTNYKYFYNYYGGPAIAFQQYSYYAAGETKLDDYVAVTYKGTQPNTASLPSSGASLYDCWAVPNTSGTFYMNISNYSTPSWQAALYDFWLGTPGSSGLMLYFDSWYLQNESYGYEEYQDFISALDLLSTSGSPIANFAAPNTTYTYDTGYPIFWGTSGASPLSFTSPVVNAYPFKEGGVTLGTQTVYFVQYFPTLTLIDNALPTFSLVGGFPVMNTYPGAPTINPGGPGHAWTWNDVLQVNILQDGEYIIYFFVPGRGPVVIVYSPTTSPDYWLAIDNGAWM